MENTERFFEAVDKELSLKTPNPEKEGEEIDAFSETLKKLSKSEAEFILNLPEQELKELISSIRAIGFEAAINRHQHKASLETNAASNNKERRFSFSEKLSEGARNYFASLSPEKQWELLVKMHDAGPAIDTILRTPFSFSEKLSKKDRGRLESLSGEERLEFIAKKLRASYKKKEEKKPGAEETTSGFFSEEADAFPEEGIEPKTEQDKRGQELVDAILELPYPHNEHLQKALIETLENQRTNRFKECLDNLMGLVKEIPPPRDATIRDLLGRYFNSAAENEGSTP